MAKTETTEKTYSEAQEAAIMEAATEAGGKINAAIASVVAERIGKAPKSVIAKAVRMGVYQAKEKTSKTGGPIETREELAEEIAILLGGKAYNGLEKAPKLALVDIRNALKAA